MAKRSRNARDEHGRWDSGGGGLKHGQTAEGNLRRELKEEYDTEPLCIDFIGYRDVFQALPDGTPTHWLALDFAVKVDPGTIRINEPHMVDDHGWFTLDSLPHPMHSQLHPFLQLHGDKLQRIMQRNQ